MDLVWRMKPKASTRKRYPSDISREQFEPIRADLEGHRKRTRPRKHDLYEVFCGLLYLLKSGCQWDMIPRDYPPSSVVYYYYAQWKQRKGKTPSLLERCLKKIGWRGPHQPWEERTDQLLHR